ncbi:MAG: DUF2750 domain-containing protein [Planctomycetota bacterium]|jgi:hypothetical protein
MNSDASGEAKERASHFLTLVSQDKPVWGLKNDSGGLATWKYDESDEKLIPFWSDRGQAEACAQVNFPDYEIFEMAAKYFAESILPLLEKQGILVGINLSDQMGGIDMPAAGLISEIQGAGA